MDDERILWTIPDAVHEGAREPAPDWLFGGPPRSDERSGLLHGPRQRYELALTDRRLIVVPVNRGMPRDDDAAHGASTPAGLLAMTPGCRSVGRDDVAEVVVDQLPVNVGEYSSDIATDIVLRSPAGAETRFRALNVRRRADDLVALLEQAFGPKVRRARIVRHGLFRRATRE